MNRKAIIIVDTQNDFTEGGALACEGGAAAAEKITLHLEEHMGDYVEFIYTQDWHPDDVDGSDFQHFKEWPIHCVENTFGAEFHEKLWVVDKAVIFRKGQHDAAYSAFEGSLNDPFDEHDTLLEYLSAAGVRDLDIVGIATDYCVKETAIDAAQHRFNTTVLLDLTAKVDLLSAKIAVDHMRSAGAKIELAHWYPS